MATEKKEPTCIVLHIERNGVYNAGDRASFPMSYAARLIQTKKVVLDDPDVTEKQVHIIASKEEAEDTGLDTRTHDLTIDGVKELIEEIEDRDELIALAEGERNHPVNSGGRVGVHSAIKARILELDS